ncbi:hypothetical protein CPC08DRAFT_602428, partial [Agrocybe pediades]
EAALAAMDINLLHRRMGHIDHARLKKMVAGGKISNISSTTGTPHLCEPCTLAKMKKLPFPKHTPSQRTTHPLQLIHSDVGGPVKPPSRDGYRY